jgi:outer membrane murein-binding lipoprotein Lpp
MHVSERINKLISAASTVTLYNLNGVGNRKGIEAGLASAQQDLADYVETLEDKVEGLSSDLDSAIEVAFKRGATEWTRLNYPEHYKRFTA